MNRVLHRNIKERVLSYWECFPSASQSYPNINLILLEDDLVMGLRYQQINYCSSVSKIRNK